MNTKELGAPEPRRENALHMIHRWSIDHAYAVAAFFIAMLFLSGITITHSMPRRFAPYVESPMLGIVTMMPGLSSREMEQYVSSPIEQQMVHVKGVKYVRSNSQTGFSIVTLEFPYGTNMQKALVDVQALMNVTQSTLLQTGANMKPSWVVLIDPLNLPALTLSLTGDEAAGWDKARLRELADNEVINRLKAVPSVYSVVPFGGYRRQMQVTVDRAKLAARGLSILDVRDAIDRYNAARPAGTVTSGETETAVRLDTHAVKPSDIAGYPLRSSATPSSASIYDQNRSVMVRDVAAVSDGIWERRSSYHYLKHLSGSAPSVDESIEVSVIQDPGASSARLTPEIMAVLRQIEREHPGIHFESAYDNSHFVEILFHNVWEELAIAVALTGLAVLLFLGEWRGTLIAMITVPTSLALAILFMAPFGMTFNSGTLVGLLLSIGRLVDDSIIDIHAVERHLRAGKSPRQATIDGIAEVRVAVIASTLMIVLALSPLLFSGGITELMFRELVWPLIFGLLASMLVSFTLTAVLCAKLLRRAEERERDRSHWLLGPIYTLIDPFQHLLNALENKYATAIQWLLQHRLANLLRVLTTLVIGFTFYYFIGSEMMPLADVGQASGTLEMAPGTSFAATEHAVRQLETIIGRHTEVEKASIEIGAETMFESYSPYYTGYQMPQANGASMMLTLSDKDVRKRSIFAVIDSIQKEAMQTIPGIRRLQIKEMGSDVMATAAAPVHINISGPDLDVLNSLGQSSLRVAKSMPELFQPAATWSSGTPEFQIVPNPVKAQQSGLTADSIAEQAYYSINGGLTSEYFRLANRRQDTILIRYAEKDRVSLNNLQYLYLTGSTGKQVLLKDVATVEHATLPTAIEHDGLRRVIGITGYYRSESLPSMDVVMNLAARIYGGDNNSKIDPVNFPAGYGMEIRGDMKEMMDSFRRMISGLTLALALMYLVLVIQFKGFAQPLQMLASLPLELSGVFIALWLAHQAFSTVSILGIIVLTGMDITTAVLLIDMIMKYREQGIPRDEAIQRACPERLRPILMTSGITLITMLPIAIAPKTGLDAYQPLATAVVGGLIVGTVLSLFDIPIMHTYVDDLLNAFQNRLRGPAHAGSTSSPIDSDPTD